MHEYASDTIRKKQSNIEAQWKLWYSFFKKVYVPCFTYFRKYNRIDDAVLKGF